MFPSIGQLQSRPAPHAPAFLLRARKMGQKSFESEVQGRRPDRFRSRETGDMIPSRIVNHPSAPWRERVSSHTA